MRPKVFSFLLALMLAAATSQADDRPLIDASRFSLGILGGVGFNADTDNDFGAQDTEARAVLNPGYSLGSMLSVQAPVIYRFGAEAFSFEPRASVVLTAPESSVGVYVQGGYGFYGNEAEEEQEAFGAVYGVVKLAPRFGLSIGDAFRVESKQNEFTVALGWIAIPGGN
jgi:hypothetical protein